MILIQKKNQLSLLRYKIFVFQQIYYEYIILKIGFEYHSLSKKLLKLITLYIIIIRIKNNQKFELVILELVRCSTEI